MQPYAYGPDGFGPGGLGAEHPIACPNGSSGKQRIEKQRIRATDLIWVDHRESTDGEATEDLPAREATGSKGSGSNGSGQQRICPPMYQLRIGKQGIRTTDLVPNRTYIGPGSNGKQRIGTGHGFGRPLAGPGNIGKQRIGKQRTGATDRPNRPLTGPGSNRKQRIGKQRIRDHLLGREATGSNGKPGIGKLDHLPAREATEATDREPTDPDHGFGIS